MQKVAKWIMLFTAIVGGLILVPGVPGRWQRPAAAVPLVTGLEWVHATASVRGVQRNLHAYALCPPGKIVLGGGGWPALTVGGPGRELSLTRLEPSENVLGLDRQGYIAAAVIHRVPAGDEEWSMHAYALCANDNLPGHHVVAEETDPSSASMQATAAVCPGGFRALGSGANVTNETLVEDVVLQVARASGTGDITRAQAHEDADGYNSQWTLTAYAVCASTPQGYEVVYGESPERDSEPTKNAIARCPDGKQLVSSGAAITNVAPAHVSLKKIFPSSHLDDVYATAVENDPTDADWDFIVAQAICTL